MTRTSLIIAVTAFLAAPSPARPDASAFNDWAKISESPLVVIGLVRSPATGVVEIYEYHAEKVGRFLGSASVHAGANPDVRVNTRDTRRHDVIARLRIGDTVVSERRYEIADR